MYNRDVKSPERVTKVKMIYCDHINCRRHIHEHGATSGIKVFNLKHASAESSKRPNVASIRAGDIAEMHKHQRGFLKKDLKLKGASPVVGKNGVRDYNNDFKVPFGFFLFLCSILCGVA